MTGSRPEVPDRTRRRGPRRSAALLLGVVVGAAVLLVTGGAPAAAHDGLVSSTPAPDSVADPAPTEVELRFSGPPLPLGTRVEVTGPHGADLSRGAAEIRDTAVVQRLAGTPGPGRYTVRWRSTSSDGHPLSGSYAFTVTAPGDPATSGPVLAAAQPAPTGPRADGGPAIGWLAGGVVALGAVGVLLARRLRGRA